MYAPGTSVVQTRRRKLVFILEGHKCGVMLEKIQSMRISINEVASALLNPYVSGLCVQVPPDKDLNFAKREAKT